MSLWAALEQAFSFGGTPHGMLLFLGNIGGSEILLILLLVLLVFGPKQLPEVAKTLGKTLKGVRKAADELRHEAGLDEAVRETRQIGNSLKRTVYASIESGPETDKTGSAASAAAPAPSPDASEAGALDAASAETGSQAASNESLAPATPPLPDQSPPRTPSAEPRTPSAQTAQSTSSPSPNREDA